MSSKRSKKRTQPKKKLNIKAEGFGLKGSISYEKRSAPAAQSLAGHTRLSRTTSVAGGEIVVGSTLICNAPYEYADAMVEININPGLSAIFPQLSPQASLYSEYKFKKLIFKYVPIVPTSQQGLIGLAFQPNVQESGPSNWTELVSFDGASFCSVWDNRCVCAAPAYDQTLYARNGDYPPESDPKTYDVGKLTILLNGYNGSISPGYIQADYEVVLTKRVLPPQLGCMFQSTTNLGLTRWTDERTSLLFNENTVGHNVIVDDSDLGNPGGSLYLGMQSGYWLLLVNWFFADGTGPPSNDPIQAVSYDGSVVVEIAPDTVWNSVNAGFGTGAQGGSVYSQVWGIYSPISASGSVLVNGSGYVQIEQPESTVPGGTVDVSFSAMLCRLPSAPSNFPQIIPPGVPPRPMSQRRPCSVIKHSKLSIPLDSLKMVASILSETRTSLQMCNCLLHFELIERGSPLIDLNDRSKDAILKQLDQLPYHRKLRAVHALNKPSSSSF